jgi:predicted acetyltransferase
VAGPTEPGGEGTTKVLEMVAFDDAVRRRLWSLAASVDLFRNVNFWALAEDDPIRLEVARFRRPGAQRQDGLWLRVLNVVEALSQRTYGRDGALRLHVVDRLDSPTGDESVTGPAEGSYRLDVEDGVGHCQRDDRAGLGGGAGEVTLSAAVLARLYLGASEAWALHRAGLIEGSVASVETLAGLFATRRAPHCPEIF